MQASNKQYLKSDFSNTSQRVSGWFNKTIYRQFANVIVSRPTLPSQIEISCALLNATLVFLCISSKNVINISRYRHRGRNSKWVLVRYINLLVYVKIMQ